MVSIFDGAAAIVSSANLNGRSLRWDTEAGVLLTDPDTVASLRQRLMAHWLFKSEPNVFSFDDLIAKGAVDIPAMLQYRTHAENDSCYNTPPCFGIYLMGLVMKWARAEGGLEAIAARNERKAAALYAEIDRTGFYRGTAETASPICPDAVEFSALKGSLSPMTVRARSA